MFQTFFEKRQAIEDSLSRWVVVVENERDQIFDKYNLSTFNLYFLSGKM